MSRITMTIIALLALLMATPAEAKRLPWCGIYLSQHLGINKRSLWIARNWAHEGTNAGGPGIGVIVVWRHHVGKIVGRAPNGQWIVHSGNDSNAIRTRPRSLAGVIAYRYI